MANANIRAIITADDKASAVLRQFEHRVDSLGHSTRELATKGLEIAMKATVALGTALSVAGGFAVKSAAEFQQTRIGLENMLGSADKARSLLADISKFAAETPFEFPELAQATRQLVAFGFSAEDAFKTMKQLGDVSAAVGAPINDLAYLMGTLRTQGRAFTIDIRQFAQRGIPIYEYLAKVLKTNEKAIVGMIEAGQIGFPEVQKAFAAMTAEGGKFHNTMSKQSQSLAGLWSTLKDVIGQSAREIIGINQQGDIREGSIFARLSQALTGLITLINAHQEQIVAFFQGLINRAIDFGKAVRTYIIDHREQIVATLTAVKDAAIGLINTVIGLVGWFKENQAAAYLLAGALTTLAAAYTAAKIAAGFTAIINALNMSIGILSGTTLTAAYTTGGLTAALKALALAASSAIVLTVAVGGVIYAIQKVYELKAAWDSAARSAAEADALDNRAINAIRNNPNLSREEKSRRLQGLLDPGFRAEGGTVLPGQPYIVGERRPELFVPNTPGKIMPSVPGGNTTINISVNAGAFTGNPSDARQYARLIMESLKEIAGSRNMTVSQMLGQ